MAAMSSLEITLLVVVLVVYAFAIGAVVVTKNPGWGRFSISIMLLTLVLFSGTVALMVRGLEFPQFANLLFAVAGFAGALLTGKGDSSEAGAKPTQARGPVTSDARQPLP